jgi:uncharacterized protein (TIGR02246 family)
MRRLFLALPVWVVLSVVLVAQANAVKDVEAVEHARMAAVEQRDVDAVAKFLTDDFTSIATSGRRSSKQQYLNGLRANPAPVKMLHEEVQVRVYGDTAIITGRSTVTRAADGAQVGLTRYTHVYVKQRQQWKLAAMHNSAVAAAE